MCLDERNTLSRGRSAEPTIFLRTRNRFRCRVTASRFCEFIGVTLPRSAAKPIRLAAAGERLAFLAADHLVVVPDALALVRLRHAGGPDLGGELPDLLLVRPLDQDRRRVRYVARHPLGRGQLDGVGVADREDDGVLVLVLAGLVADPLDLQ